MKVDNKTIIITDPCYIVPDNKDDDWYFFCEHEYFNIPELTNYISEATGCGDWSCTTYNSDTNEVLGKFCADSGTVGVFELDEIIKYNPNFPGDLPTKCYTQIDNFSGNINIEEEEHGVTVVGDGNIKFHTEQTGW